MRAGQAGGAQRDVVMRGDEVRRRLALRRGLLVLAAVTVLGQTRAMSWDSDFSLGFGAVLLDDLTPGLRAIMEESPGQPELIRCFHGSGVAVEGNCKNYDVDGDGDFDIADLSAWLGQPFNSPRVVWEVPRRSRVVVASVVDAAVVPGGAGQSDRIAYRVGAVIVEGQTQGLHLLGFDLLTNTGVAQPFPQQAWGEYDGFSNAEALWATWKGAPVFNGGWGADNAGLPTEGTRHGDDILGAGSSLGLWWDADADDDESNGYQPERRAGIGIGEFRGWNGGPGDPFDDDATWPPGDNDGQVIRDGVWTWFTGEIAVEDGNGQPIPPGTYQAQIHVMAANVIATETDEGTPVDLRLNWPRATGTWIERTSWENGDVWLDSRITFDVTIDGDGAARIRNVAVVSLSDCNGNGIDDLEDIGNGTSTDCDGDGVPDECESDCNGNGVADGCDIAEGTSQDCNGNGWPDECEEDCNGNGVADDCDVRDGTSQDCDGNSVPDECEPDCNGNGVADACDIRDGTSEDCNADGVPDECQWNQDCNGNGVHDACDIRDGTSEDCDGNDVPDECEADCNGNGINDTCDIRDGRSEDCDHNNVPDECEEDCNGNGIDDTCDVWNGTSYDCNGDYVPDECQDDCNGNGLADECDIDEGRSEDCDEDGVPDECQEDCNGNGVNDICDIRDGTSADCNGNAIPDECDLANGVGEDCNGNGVLDECDPDCNDNGQVDECEILEGLAEDCNGNGVPDECDMAGGPGWKTLWDNGVFDGVNALASERDTLVPEASTADDFVVDVAGHVIEEVRAVAINQPGLDLAGADVIIYGVHPDGGPDESNVVFEGLDMPVTEVRVTGTFEYDVNELTIEMPLVPIEPGEYFLVVRGVGNGPGEGNRSFWATTGNGSVQGQAGWFRSEYFGFAEWTPVEEVMGMATDFAFEVRGRPVDCNGNGVPDECDIAEGTSADCNGNGLPDECESLPDTDGDGVPDECDLCPLGPGGSGVDNQGVPLGDFDRDCDVDIADFMHFTACFTGSGRPVEQGCADADLDADGDVDVADFGTFVSGFTGSL